LSNVQEGRNQFKAVVDLGLNKEEEEMQQNGEKITEGINWADQKEKKKGVI